MENEQHPSSVRGIDFEFENKQSCNKLLTAVMNCDEKSVKKLLKNNWSPNSSDNVGRTAVHLAARSSSLYRILKILLDFGGYPDHVTHSGVTALCLAAYAGLDKTVALLLDRGASVSKKNDIDANALHFACNSQHPSVEVVRLLLNAGVPIDGVDLYKTSPLMLAVKNKHSNIVRYLLDKGANLMLEDSDEKTAFHYAVSSDDLELFNILLKKVPDGVVVGDLSDREGWTLLMLASQSHAVRIVDKLLELGCDTSKRNANGLMALHLAAHNSPSCFESLLDGTPIEVINSQCTYSDKPITNSIPCLLIDAFYLESLKLLFNKTGIDENVLTCPLVKQKQIFPPVPFSLFSDNSLDFVSSVVQLYIDKKLSLDPFFLPSQTVTCLESLITAHVNHNMIEQDEQLNRCCCAELFIKLLENGASPDPYTIPEDLHSNYVLWYFCINGSIFGLSYLLRYSNYLEPHNVLRMFTSLILEANLFTLSHQFAKTIKFLCKYSRPWDVAECKQLMTSGIVHQQYVNALAASFNRCDAPFPSLKFLSRTVLREHRHSVLSLLSSQSGLEPLDYNHGISQAFRQFLSDLPLPKSLLSYLEYDDIIYDVKMLPGFPSFEL